MATANATPAKHKRKGPSLADALEILTANLGMLVAAGAQVEHVVEGGVLTVRVNGVAERRDAEGVYFAPADEVTNGD